jgi:hypothetical protein
MICVRSVTQIGEIKCECMGLEALREESTWGT